MKRVQLIIFFLLIFFYNCYSNEKIILKIKTNTPLYTVENLKRNNIKNDYSNLGLILNHFKVTKSSQFIDNNSLKQLDNNTLKKIGLDRIFIIEVIENNQDKLIQRLEYEDNIEYVQKVNILKLNFSLENTFIPNDPYYSKQYYLNETGFNFLWNYTLGDSNIVIAVIDSGLDFLHPDLQNSYKLNYGEYGNGKESNGIDDDNNGYIDDWRGWNFIYNNNDPTDDNIYSHGTAVTGVINASINNGIGIASASPKCKVLVLKAFDRNGYGAEDIISYAILYAVSAGVKVMNFSFGDFIYSNLLRDVINFAYEQNITMIASAGNDGSNRLHYPSAFGEVISVGASNQFNYKATFSSFGETVDIFAPGEQILTTSRRGFGLQEFEGDYFYISGTSFSAPIVASAAAILKVKNNNLTNEEIRGILVSNTKYLTNQNKWDHYNSSGLLQINNSFNNVSISAISKIYYPYQALSSFKDSIPLYISAVYPYSINVSLRYCLGEKFENPNVIYSTTGNQILKDTVGFWNIKNLPDTTFTLRLIINTYWGRTIEDGLIFYKDSKEPEFIETPIKFEVYDKSYKAELVSFTSNKPTLGRIYYKRKNINEPYQFVFADLGFENIGYVSKQHLGLLKHKNLIPNTFYEYYLELEGTNGKKKKYEDTTYYFLTESEINLYGYNKKNYTLPTVQVCKKIVDINNNTEGDVFVNLIKDNLKLEVYEFTNNQFHKISNNNWGEYIIAKDLGDINRNGKIDLLTSKNRNGILYEQETANNLPTKKIWSDEGLNNFWSCRFADCDKDSNIEMLGFGKYGLRIIEYNTNQFQEVATLHYSVQDAESNSQNVIVEDFDSDGKNEIVFTEIISDYSNIKTNILFFKCKGNNFYERINIYTLDGLFVKGDNISIGDFDNDNKKEILIGGTAKDDIIPIFYLSIFKYSNNAISEIDRIKILQKNSSLSSSTDVVRLGNIDAITLNTGGEYYIFIYTSSLNKFTSIYNRSDINSVNQLIYDFDKNGTAEIGVNDTISSMIFLEKPQIINQPLPPSGITGYSMDSNEVFISFNQIIGADYYKIYRSENDSLGTYILIDSTIATNYYDRSVSNKKKYYYRISSVDTSLEIKESALSNFISIYVHNKSKLIDAKQQGSKFITLKFSQKINYFMPPPDKIIIDNIINPQSVSYNNEFEYLISFSEKLPEGYHQVKTRGLRDFYNSPVDTNTITFLILQKDSLDFYIKSATAIGKNKIKVEFNMEIDSTSAVKVSNYSITPFDIKIINIEIDKENKNTVFLNIFGSNFGASGRNYLLRVSNVYSKSGIKITSGSGSTIGFVFTEETLDNVVVYPNPYTSKLNQKYITFANLTPIATIYIFDLNGRFIAEIKETDMNGGVDWDLKDNNGNELPSGIYIYRVTGKNSKGEEVKDFIGKFAIVK
ncbi:MAG: S8 family serine peptidase [Ignavibacteria bacterium]|nr:S8 family serine peptidase [Ignavibacteria bacterium]